MVVVGDGPAGSALAQEFHRRDVDVMLLGPDEPWTNTYGTWADDVEAVEMLAGIDLWMHRMGSIDAWFTQHRTVDRPYGVIDNVALRAALRSGVEHRVAVVDSVTEIDARVVVDATGWPSRLGHPGRNDDHEHHVAWQTAYGVVLPEPPSGRLGSPMLMDYSDPGVDGDTLDVPSFAYALPVVDGWLVEETVLAASPAVEPQRLVERLASRLGSTADDLTAAAVRIEGVHIPMGARIPTDDELPDRVVRYGAAAGMIHPATGYSISSSLSHAGSVANAVRRTLDRVDGAPAMERVLDDDALVTEARHAVWPVAARRTRLLHEYGSNVLIGSDRAQVCSFFDTFFDLPDESWPAYLRIDTQPSELAAVMTAMFRRADWRLRALLVSSNPLPFVRLIRP